MFSIKFSIRLNQNTALVDAGTRNVFEAYLEQSYIQHSLFSVFSFDPEILSLIVSNNILATLCDVIFTILLGIGLLSALLWSISFEAVANKSNVKLTQSAMRNEFYKSRNAMAYYGPPTGIEMEE